MCPQCRVEALLFSPDSAHTSRLVRLAGRLLCVSSRELCYKAAAAQREADFHWRGVKSQIALVFMSRDGYKLVTVNK